MSLGALLSELRMKRRQSLQQVADAVGVSKAHIWELERGRTANPSMTLLKALADHFEVSVGRLMGLDGAGAEPDDPQLRRMFREAGTLDERERAILDEMLQTLIRTRRSPQD